MLLKLCLIVPIDYLQAMRRVLIDRESIATVNGHLAIFRKGSFGKSYTKMTDLQDDCSQGPSIDLWLIGRCLVGKNHCIAAMF